MSITLLANLANASSTFESEPANLESLKQTISKSLVAVTCQVPTIGYSEDVAFTDNDKNNGRNSFIVTSYRNLLPCIQNRNIPVTVTYKGQSYKAEVWGWSQNPDDDLASVMTSVIVPPISDWSRYRPQKNWWLLYVQWGEGALLSNPKVPEPVFSSTRVFAVRDQEFTFSISPGPFKLGLMKYGLFFDVEGKFVGSLRWKWDDDPASATGFPRICTVAGGSSNDRSLLNCNSTREKYWEKFAPTATPAPTTSPTRSPSPTPTPSPSIGAIDASLAARDAHVDAVSAYKLYTESVVTCLKAFQGKNSNEKRILALVSGVKICTSEESTSKSAHDRNLSLAKTISSSKTPSELISLIDQFNSFTDTFNVAIIAMEDAILMADILSKTANELDKIEMSLASFSSDVEDIDSIVGTVPLRVANLITKGSAFEKLDEIREVISSAQSQIDDALSEIEGIAYPDPEAAEDLATSLVEIIESLPSETSITQTIKRAYDAIPDFYCKKSKSVSLPKKGKCATGFSKVAIDKGTF